MCPVPFSRGLHPTSGGGSVLTTTISLRNTVIISAPRESIENLVHLECSVFSLQFPFLCGPLGHPALASSPLRRPGRPRYGLGPSSVGRPSSLVSFLNPLRTERPKWRPKTPSAKPRPFCVGRSLRRAPRPPKAPPRAKGRLEPRTAPPVPGLQESYRRELRGTRTQTRVTPRASASAPRPAAPARTASRSPEQPPPSPLHKMAAGPLRSSAFQKGRGRVTDVTGRSGASGLSISGSSRKLPVFLVRSLRRLRTSSAFRGATLPDGISSCLALGFKQFLLFEPLRKEENTAYLAELL